MEMRISELLKECVTVISVSTCQASVKVFFFFFCRQAIPDEHFAVSAGGEEAK